MTTLKEAKTGFQISGLPSQAARKINVLMDLLRDLGIVVYESAAHRDHQFFEEECSKYSDQRLLEAIATHWGNSPTCRALTREEATELRELVLACSDIIAQAWLPSVGELPIWTIQGSTESSPLIPASEAYYLEGHFDLKGFEEFPNVLCSDGVHIFKVMGANPLKATVALTDFVLPKFHDRALQYEGDTKTAYLTFIGNLLNVSRLQGKLAAASRSILNTVRCYVARDGSFHGLRYLIVPDEAVTKMLFEDRPEVFVDDDMYLLMKRFPMSSNIRSMGTHPELVLECAEKVLAETMGMSADLATWRRAFQLVKYIYKNSEAGGVDWMDVKWKIVPR